MAEDLNRIPLGKIRAWLTLFEIESVYRFG